MNVFVTGGAGYIGSICVEELLKAGHTVTVLDNLSEGHRTGVDPRARFVLGDLKDAAGLPGLLREAKAEAILHFAANASVGESMRNPAKYFQNNVGCGANLLGAAVEAGVRKVIFSSTCAVYGLPEHSPITEHTPTAPINPYGESKLMVERMLSWFERIHGLEYVALRYFNAAGASDLHGEHHRVETHLIPNVLKVALGQAPHCDIFGTDYPTPDGTCIRDYVHIHDLAQAHILAMAPGLSGMFNLGNGSGYSVREVIQACRDVSGVDIKAREKPRRPGDPIRLVAASEKARSVLGWKPRYGTLDHIVRSAWHWHQQYPRGYPD